MRESGGQSIRLSRSTQEGYAVKKMTQNKRERGVAATESGTARHTLRLHAVCSCREMNHSGSRACGIVLVPALCRQIFTQEAPRKPKWAKPFSHGDPSMP